MLFLVAVVVAGAALGSALHSDKTPRTVFTARINQAGGWTGYVVTPSPKAHREMCARLEREAHHRPKTFPRASLRAVIREMCKSRR